MVHHVLFAAMQHFSPAGGTEPIRDGGVEPTIWPVMKLSLVG
jgi:hypothetical protein